LRLGALIGTLIIVIIELSIAKVIRILDFNYILILGISSKGLKGLIELYIIYFIILKLVNIIYSLLGIFQILTVQVVGYILIRLLIYFISCYIIRSFKLVNNNSYIFILPPQVIQQQFNIIVITILRV
jgi:hypothetical protein